MSEWNDAQDSELIATLRDSVDAELADEIEKRLRFRLQTNAWLLKNKTQLDARLDTLRTSRLAAFDNLLHVILRH